MAYIPEGKRKVKVLIDMMNTLLSPKIQVVDKKHILEEEYHIVMNDGLGKELGNMGPFTEYAIECTIKQCERAEKEGCEAGIKEDMMCLVK